MNNAILNYIEKNIVTTILCILMLIGMICVAFNFGNTSGVWFGFGVGIVTTLSAIVFFAVIQNTLQVNR